MSAPDSASEFQDFSLGRVLVFAWRIFRQHFWVLLIPSLCSGLLFHGLIILLELPPKLHGLAFSAWGIFVGVIVTIGVYRSLLGWSRGEDRPTIGGVFSLGLRGWWDGVRAGFVLLLYSLFLALFIGLFSDLLRLILNVWVYGVLAAALTIWLLSRSFLSLICMADEGQGAFDAVHRGLSLTEGKSLRIAPSIVLLAVAFVGFTMAMLFGFYWLQRPFPSQTCMLAFAILSEPFIYAFVFAAYLELKNQQKPAWSPGAASSPDQAPPAAPQDGA